MKGSKETDARTYFNKCIVYVIVVSYDHKQEG